MKRKADLTTFIGILISLGGIAIGYYLEGGDFKSLLAISPLLIIFGGTIGVVIITQPSSALKQFPSIFKQIFVEKEYDYLTLIDNLCKWTRTSRQEGIIVLEDVQNEIDDPFLRKGITLIVNSTDPEDVKEFLESEIDSMIDRHHKNAQLFESAGGYSPTMGIIGTVLGLIVVLGHIGSGDPSLLGHGIATAFLATFMGIAFANLVCLPFANKLKNKSDQEVLYREITMQGLIAIQQQESPLILRDRLMSSLPEYLKKQMNEKGVK